MYRDVSRISAPIKKNTDSTRLYLMIVMWYYNIFMGSLEEVYAQVVPYQSTSKYTEDEGDGKVHTLLVVLHIISTQ